MQRMWVLSLGQEDSPGEGDDNAPQYFCQESPNGQSILAGYSPWGHKRVGYDLLTKTTAEIDGKQANLVYSLIDFYTCAHMYRAIHIRYKNCSASQKAS